jgi:hypothetical protein
MEINPLQIIGGFMEKDDNGQKKLDDLNLSSDDKFKQGFIEEMDKQWDEMENI